MQNKNINANLPKKQNPSYSIGVFLIIIIGLWFVSFKIIGSGPNKKDLNPFTQQDQTQDQGKDLSLFKELDDYPVMIIFDNHPDSKAYLSGISQAAVVYEWLAEGGATRFAGVYSGAPEAEKIGPVRSARPYVVEIASGWSAFFLHAGGSPEALDLIKSYTTDIVDLNEISGLGEIYFWRDRNVPGPHNLFTSAERIALGIQEFELDELPMDKLLWQWEDDGNKIKFDDNAKSATMIYIDFSEGLGFDAQYEYDSELELYKRSMGGLEHKDHADDAQLTAANIIIQRIPWEGFYESGLGRIKLNLIGEGDMILFQKGKIIQGAWKKDKRDDQTIWLNDKSEPIVLARGQTWIEIVPGTRVVSFE